MSDYTFCASLVITHPSIDPDTITTQLQLQPRIQRKAGESRRTPAGTELLGINRESCWRANLHEEHRLASVNVSIEAFISKTNERLRPHKAFLRSLIDDGAYIEYFIGWFGGFNASTTLEPDLLMETAQLGIAIGFDVYAESSTSEENTPLAG